MTDATLTQPRDEGAFATYRAIGQFFKRNFTPRTGVTLVVWRIEALMITPMSIFFIETLGRWRGAFAMSCAMAAFSLFFVLMLAGEPIMADFRRWLGERKWGHWSMRIAERRDAVGAVQRALGVFAIIAWFGPFFRAITMETFRVRRPLALLIAVGGAFPHNMFWTGVVFGSFWELVSRPAIMWLWDTGLSPALSPVWDAIPVV